MAQSRKPPAKSSYLGKDRKAKIINHEPIVKTETKIPNAEPVAMDFVEDKNIETAKESLVHPTTLDNPTKDGSKDEKIHRENNENIAIKPKDSHHKDSFESETAIKYVEKSQKKGGFFASFLGGVVALILGVLLGQYGNLPTFYQKNENVSSNMNGDISAFSKDITTQIATLREDVTAVQNVLQQTPNGLENAMSNGENTTALAQNMNNIEDSVEKLNARIEAVASTADSPSAFEKSARETFAKMTQQITDLEQELANFKLQAQQNLEQQNKDSQASLVSMRENGQAIAALKQQITGLEEKMQNPIQGKEVAVFMAANDLKNAVDRGGSYQNELNVFKNIAPEIVINEKLQQNASLGLPNQATLASDFASIADKIAATENIVSDNANIGEKMWASAKSFVVTRPIGNVEGDNPAAIAARMEVAIANGDYQTALNLWQNLPDSAKAVSKDFIKTLSAKQALDIVLGEIVAASLKTNGINSTNIPAPQNAQ